MQSTPIPAARQPQDDNTPTIGLTDQQTLELLKPIDPRRVTVTKDGTRRLKHQDVRRRLSQIFGFTGWAEENLSLDCIKEYEEKNGLWTVVYRARVRIHIRDGRGGSLTFFDGVGVWDGTQRQMKRGFTETVIQTHHNVANGACSVAFLRAAMNLGDQFGLSLHLDEPPAHGYVRYTITLPESIPAPEPVIVAQPPQPPQNSTTDTAADHGDDEPNTPSYDDEYDTEDEQEDAMAG